MAVWTQDGEKKEEVFFFIFSWLPDLARSFLLGVSLLGQFTEPVEFISPAEDHVLFAREMNSAGTESSQSWRDITGGVERARKVLFHGWKWICSVSVNFTIGCRFSF